METHDCRGSDWPTKITEAIEASAQGDTLILATPEARELAMRAKERMRPGLEMSFLVVAS